MGFFQDIGRSLGFSKSKDQGDFGGTKPFKSLKEIEEGRITSTELKDRLAGRNVGFRPGFIGLAGPAAEQRRASLRERELPALSASASGRGIGRSTVVTGQEQRAQAGASRDIEERVAQLTLADEQQRRSEINDALARIQQFTTQEAAQRGQAAEFDFREFNRQQGFRERARAGQDAAFQNTINTALAATKLGGQITGAGSFAPTQFNLTPTGTPQTPLFGAGTPQPTGGTGGAQTVNIGGTDLEGNDLVRLINALQNQ